MKIGKSIQFFRIQQGISKTAFCAKTKLNKGYLYRLENDHINPTLKMVEKIANALDISLSTLILHAENKNEYETPENNNWGAIAETKTKI